MAEGREAQVPDEYRTRLRAAVLQASQLLSGNAVDKTIPAILASMGVTLEVDRVLILEGQGNETAATLCYAWQREGVLQITPDFLGEYPSSSAELRMRLAPLVEGQIVCGYPSGKGTWAGLAGRRR